MVSLEPCPYGAPVPGPAAKIPALVPGAVATAPVPPPAPPPAFAPGGFSHKVRSDADVQAFVAGQIDNGKLSLPD
ncbi:uncharacterized protein N7500_008315 [Penicillium coprophilum]|uniref:uncharacterized protein n=1 Tax=Penicillium coprophilum TaxID=36646 RepID=UPI00238394CA|nr:uncharacterized protein N7500_008315 [Penicillium coprophilum]KAJ5158664.1 hypothetical protein N7500_008315 [Penicillium coprophilum]